MEPQDILEEHIFEIHEVDKGVRFLNLVIDMLCFFVLSLIIGVILGIILFSISETAALEFFGEDDSLKSRLMERVMGAIIIFVYYFISEASSGRTIGKLITGTVVVDEYGNKPTKEKIAYRSLSRLVPFEAFSFLGSGRGWHDKWSDTYVVRKKDLDFHN